MVCPRCNTELQEEEMFGDNHVCGGCGDLVVVREVDTEEIEIEAPDCFNFFDGRDNSCRMCKLKGYCIEATTASRPGCFGSMHDGSEIECVVCLLASLCIESKEKEISKMAKVTVRKKGKTGRAARTRRPRPTKTEPKVEEKVEEEIEEVEEEQSYTDMHITALRKLCKSRDLESGGSKSTVIKRLISDDSVERDEEEVEEEVEEVEVEEVEVDGDPYAELMSRVAEGESLLFTNKGDGSFIVSGCGCVIGIQGVTSTEPAKKKNAGLTGKAFEKEAYSEDFYSFFYEDAAETGTPWKDLTPKQRYEIAAEVEAEWNEHEKESTDQMRMGQAVREALGIEKWKEEYSTRAARKALKEG